MKPCFKDMTVDFSAEGPHFRAEDIRFGDVRPRFTDVRPRFRAEEHCFRDEEAHGSLEDCGFHDVSPGLQL